MILKRNIKTKDLKIVEKRLNNIIKVKKKRYYFESV